MSQNRRGFTLIELMIVVVIIAIVAAVVLPLAVHKQVRDAEQLHSDAGTLVSDVRSLADSTKLLKQELEWLQQSLAERKKHLDQQEQDLAEAANWLRDGVDAYTVMARPFSQAIVTGYRREGITVNTVAEKTLLTPEERARLSGLMALGWDGSYSDLVLPCLGDYQSGYDSLIVSASNDNERAEICHRYMGGLRLALQTLDGQIWAHEKFRRRAVEDFNGWYTGLHGYAPADSDRYGISWKQFVAEHPRYAQSWPGFYSTTIDTWRDNRPIGDYHAREKQFLQSELARLPETLTLAQYHALAKRFPDRIAYRSIG